MKSKFKVFLGPAGIPISSKSYDTVEGVKRVAELGLRAMEVEFVHSIYMNNQMAESVGKEAKDRGVRLSVHAPYYVNLCTDDARKLAASKMRIFKSAERAKVMGATVVVFHPGFYGMLKEQDAFERIVTACEEIVERVPNDVKIGLETTGKISAFGTLDEVVSVCKKVRNCVPVIDFAHVFARQDGAIDYGKVLDTVKPLRLEHLHTHFSNIEFTTRGERSHAVLDSAPPFEPLAKEILRRKQPITIICESPILELDSLRMKGIFEKLGHNWA